MLTEMRIYLKMCLKVYFLFATVLIFITDIANSDNTIDKSTKKTILKMSDLFDKSKMIHYYPLIWTEIDYKPMVDNDRLFKKYKNCVIAENSYGCPRMVTEFKKLIPEIVATMCAKCLPIHIDRFKEAASYICHKRPADYDEVRRIKDPDGAIQARFEAKFGKLDC